MLTWFSTQCILGQSIQRLDDTQIDIAILDAKIDSLQKNAHVHGLTVSIVSRDAILFQKAYGTSNSSENTPLKITDNFYAASLSKALFSYIVMRLVDEGQINLDKPLVQYLDRPLPEYRFKEAYEGYDDLVSDDRYTKITARMCLSHTTGFPNWRYIGKYSLNMERKLSIGFDPGTQYRYSGEGIQLLQFIVEKITNKSLETLARDYVFDPFHMEMTSFTWQKRFNDNYALGHTKKGKPLDRKKRKPQYAAGSMDTTPQEYTRFIQAMLEKRALSDTAFNEMISPQITITSKQQFGKRSKRRTSDNETIALSYGLGWGLYTTPRGKAVFKEGHIQGWEHYVAFYPESDLAIVIMSNSSNAESIFKELLEICAGDTWLPWYWMGYYPND